MIIIPTYNERKNIILLVGRIRSAFPEIPILFVDDNSPDGTSGEITTLQQQDRNIHLLIRPSKAGFASAYLAGFKEVLEKFQPEVIVTMDADLSHSPEKIPELLAIAKEGRIAIGSRYSKSGSVKNWGLKRKILSRMGNLYARLLTKLPVKDLTSGFMAIPVSKLRALNLDAIENNGYAFLMELKFKLAELNSSFVEVPITFEERKSGESKLAGNIVFEGIKYPAKLFWQRQLEENSPAWLIFFISLAVYISTLPRTIFFGDSPEFMASVATMGIPHPPGYPTYILLAKLFTFLPFGSLEFRIGLFSAFCGSLSLVVFYFLFLKIAKHRFFAFISALILGFSSLFWSQAIMAKVYMPLLLVVLIILLLIVKFWETKRAGFLIASMFLFGLGTGLHQMMLLFLALVMFAVLVNLVALKNPFAQKFSLRNFLSACFLFLLGLGFYLYLPIRENMSGNYYDFARIFRSDLPGRSLSNLIHYFLRVDYADFGGKFEIRDKFLFISSYAAHLWQQFYWLLLLLPFGLIFLWRLGKKFFGLTLLAFLINVLGIILLRSSGWNPENEFLYSFYYLPSYAVVALWIGLGFVAMWEFLSGKLTGQEVKAVNLVVLILPIFLFQTNLPVNNLSNFTFVDDYTRQTLLGLAPNAVLLAHYPGSSTDTLLFGFFYQQTAKHLRPDVTILTTANIYPQADPKIVAYVFGLEDPARARYYLIRYVLRTPDYNKRPIYTTYLADKLNTDLKWSETSNGLVYKFNADGFKQQEQTNYYQLDFEKDLGILKNDLFGQDLLAQYFYAQAAYWAGKQDLKNTQGNLNSAVEFDHKVTDIDREAFIYYRNRVIGK